LGEYQSPWRLFWFGLKKIDWFFAKRETEMRRVSAMVMLVFMLVLTLGTPGIGQDAEKAEEALRQQEPPLDIILVLDNSGSMKKNDPQFLTREVVKNFVGGLGDNARLGMVIFGREAELAESLTEMTGAETKAGFLKSLEKVNYKGQFTNSPAGIERAIYELKTNAGPDAQKVIIFLTDGIVDTGDKDQDIEKEKWLKEDLAQESKLEGIRIFGVAFTDKADFRLIQTLALKTDGEYFRAYKAEDIQGVFKDIHAVISKPPVEPETPTPQEPLEAPKPETPEPETTQQVSPAPASAPVPPIVEKKGISQVLIIAGAAALAGIFILVLIFRGKSKKAGGVIRPDTPAQREEVAIPRAELIDQKKVISDQSLVLGKRSVKIGRDQTNDITIPQDTVSSLHAIIEFKGGYFYLEDQRSSNGTRLNNREIEPHKSIRLKSGDRIQFDVFEFTFSIPGQAEAGKTVLSGKKPAPSGTTLRSSEPKGPASQTPGGSRTEDAKAEPPAAESPAPPAQESATRIKPDMCPNHASLKATELCPVCKKAFCQKCMTEKDGKAICGGCAQSQ